jgi:hypothetical protein
MFKIQSVKVKFFLLVLKLDIERVNICLGSCAPMPADAEQVGIANYVKEVQK